MSRVYYSANIKQYSDYAKNDPPAILETNY